MEKTMSCEKHPTKFIVETSFGQEIEFSMEELADRIEDMRYDKVAEFLRFLAEAFLDRSVADNNAGKRKLAVELQCVYGWLSNAASECEEAWEICKPHMLLEESD